MTENSCFILSALILKSDWIRHDNHMYHLQTLRRLYRPWPQSPRGGDHLKEKPKREEKKKKILMTNLKINSPTWVSTEMKKLNTCCYYYVTSVMYKTATES